MCEHDSLEHGTAVPNSTEGSASLSGSFKREGTACINSLAWIHVRRIRTGALNDGTTILLVQSGSAKREQECA